VAIRVGEVRRARQQRLPSLFGFFAFFRRDGTVVAQDELLVEDLRVEVGLDVDIRLQQGRGYAPVPGETAIGRRPLPFAQRFLEAFTFRRDRPVLVVVVGQAFLAEVILLEHDPDPDAAPAGVEDGLCNRLGVDLLDGDVERGVGIANEVHDHLLEVVGRTQVLGPNVCLDLSSRELWHSEMGTLLILNEFGDWIRIVRGHGEGDLRPDRAWLQCRSPAGA
jgi:hypothetical protein